MSLINDALKRTEADKRSRSGGRQTPPTLVPGDDSTPSQRRRRALVGDVGSVVLTVALLAVGVFCVLWVVGPDADLIFCRVRAAAAAQSPNTADEEIAELDARMLEMAAASRWAASQAEIALRKTMEAVSYYRPPTESSARQPASGAADGPAAAGSRAADLVAAPAGELPGTGIAPSPPSRAEPPAAAASADSPSPPQPGRPPQPPLPTSEPQPPQPRYRLTGIVAGENGRVAIINGFYVREGQTVEDARVVRVGQHTVVLEVDGVRMTLKM